MPINTSANIRRSERIPKAVPIGLVVSDSRSTLDGSALTLDISLRGASVRTRLALAPGERVGIIPQGEFSHPIPARAVWVQEDATGQCTYAGLEFLDA